ncbi:hypothetical protein HGP17_28740 [Rhizobium sp. P38BS-XIX]|nr:helix-turn-helix domain-containing protein [Rhizobium sp. P38BS-XIX]NLS00836.1 hypothetical protein [Rhizobium sp. P38BS-XIX]
MSASDTTAALPASVLTKAMSGIRAIGIGLSRHSARGWARSAEEARRALDFGRNHDRAEYVRLFSDIAVEESMRVSDSVSLYVTSLLEQLAGETDLVQTVEVYFRNRMHKKATAGELGIHANTLSYRLERIQNILGASLDDVSVPAKLDVALKLRRTRR